MRSQEIKRKNLFFNAIIRYYFDDYKFKKEVYGKLKTAVSQFNGFQRRVFYYCYFTKKKINICQHSMRGRAMGKHVCLSKGRRAAFSFYKTNLAVSNLTFFFSVVRLYYIPQTTKLYGLVLASNLKSYITPITARMSLFRLSIGCLFFSTFAWEKVFAITFKYLRKCDSLLYVVVQTQVCLIPANVWALPTYIRAPGSVGVVIRRFFFRNSAIILIRLPSSDVKVFDVCTCAFFGFVCLRERSFLKNTRAGFHRSLGQRPTVRGTVKNPVDHPHGGRERTVSWPRSPWGWSTK